MLAGACRREFIFKLGAVIGKQPSWECAFVYTSPGDLMKVGPQLAQVERNSTGTAGLPVCACLCPGGFGCRAEAGQIQIIARQREGRGGGEARWEGLSLGLYLGDVKLGICCRDRLVLFVGP